VNHVTADFPPAFISGGNTDPLTKPQSVHLAEGLSELDVHVTTLFFTENHEPGQPHKYQFNLDSEEGQRALEENLQFLERVFASVGLSISPFHAQPERTHQSE
jgi:acetyl esterase/lipase